MITEINLHERNSKIIFYKTQIDEKIRHSEIRDIRSYLQENMDIIKYDNDLMVVWYLGMVADKEMQAGKKSVFERVASLEELLERYRKLKFYMRRIEYDVMEEAEEFYSFLSEQRVSEFELMGIVDSCVYDKEKVWKNFQ